MQQTLWNSPLSFLAFNIKFGVKSWHWMPIAATTRDLTSLMPSKWKSFKFWPGNQHYATTTKTAANPQFLYSNIESVSVIGLEPKTWSGCESFDLIISTQDMTRTRIFWLVLMTCYHEPDTCLQVTLEFSGYDLAWTYSYKLPCFFVLKLFIFWCTDIHHIKIWSISCTGYWFYTSAFLRSYAWQKGSNAKWFQ